MKISLGRAASSKTVAHESAVHRLVTRAAAGDQGDLARYGRVGPDEDLSLDVVADQVTVRSPFGLMAVRGTRFFAGPSNGVFGVFVERGSVLVVGVQTAVLVTSGFGTNIARPGAEPTDSAAWGAARIANAFASVSP